MKNDDCYKKPEPKFCCEDTAYDIGLRGEKRLKKRLKGPSFLTAGSGKGRSKGDAMHGKGDTALRHGYLRMIEKKTTTKKQMTLEHAWLEKIEKQAFDAGKEPVVVIDFDFQKKGSQMWGMVPLDKLNELFELEDRNSV